MNSQKSVKGIILFFISILIGIILFLFFYNYIKQPSIVSVHTQIGLENENALALVIGDQYISTDKPLLKEEKSLYIPLDTIQAYLSEDFFLDREEKVVIYTTPEKVYRFGLGEIALTINNKPGKIIEPIKEIDEVVYVPSTLLIDLLKLEINIGKNPAIVTIDQRRQNKNLGYIGPKKGYIYYGPDKSGIAVDQLRTGEVVRIFGEEGQFYKIRNEKGIVGFVLKSSIEHTKIICSEESFIQEDSVVEAPKINGPINMVWHQTTTTAANGYVEKVLEETKGVQVLSPTWLKIDVLGNVNSIASKDYVTWAHKNGYQVWPLLDNSFDPELTHKVLSSSEKRRRVIDHLVGLSKVYGFDGINVDFESVARADGPYFVQFIKELAPILKAEGLVVSMDAYVPSASTAHYNRKVVGEYVDYVMIMAYDEHWSTSPESGSVSSMGFVERAIVNTLKEVPESKIVLGVPFYTRLWKEEHKDGKVTVSSTALGMNAAYNTLKDNADEIIWLDDIGQYYGEYKEGDTLFRIWLEDERSMEERMKLFEKYDLAGVAAWKIGLEKSEIWDIIHKYTKE